VPEELVDLGGEREFAIPGEAIEQLGDERVEPMGADPAAGLPEDRGGGCDRGPVLSWAAAGPRRRPRPRRTPQQPDSGLAVDTGHRHDFVQEPVFLGATGTLVSLALFGGVLPEARSGHGHLLAGFGNPDF
jgi:hypothetical protein